MLPGGDTIDKKDLVTVRDFVPGDLNFILSTWLRGLKYGNDLFNDIPSDIYFPNYKMIVEAMLAKPHTEIKVSCLVEDPEVILGYSVYHASVLDWVFVKRAWRGIGIARSLVPSTITAVSHLTKSGRSILQRRQGIIFNPFAV